ncbi:MAG: gliding motility-associated C-terminal domain-containing protein [Bacteroidota bacterium]
MRYCIIIVTLLFGNLLSSSLTAQETPLLSVDKKEVSPGDTVQVCIKGQNISGLISLQFTLAWDTEVLDYLRADDFGLPTASSTNLAEVLAPQGNMPFVWFDAAGQGVELQDSSNLFCLYFLAKGNTGDSSLVSITDTPTPIQLGRLNNDNIEAITPIIEQGCIQLVDPALLLDFEVQNNDCFGFRSGSINVSVQGGSSPFEYSWSGPDNFQSDQESINQLLSGTYFLTVSDAAGQTVQDSVVVGSPLQGLQINSQTTAPDCNTANGSIALIVSGGTSPYQYDFGSGFVSDSIQQNLAAGSYLIVAKDANDCMLDTIINIETPNFDPLIPLPTSAFLCSMDSIVLEAPAGLNAYQWFINNQPFAQGQNITVTEAGTYRLDAFNADGCAVSGTTVVQDASIEGTISGDTNIELGEFTILTAGEGSDYVWSPIEGLSCTDCQSPMAAPSDSITYTVQYLSAQGCLVTDSISIRVEIPENQLRFEPTTFISPNGDGENDVLRFPGLETYQSNEIKIYSRWGQIVFSRINYQIEGELWDGTLRGQPLPPGVYYYILRVDEQDLFVKQTLTLVRE